MIREVILFLSIGVVSSGCAASEDARALTLTAELEHGNVVARLRNDSVGPSKTIGDVRAVFPKDPGFYFEVLDEKGVKHEFCGQINQSAATIRTLPAGASYEYSLSPSMLRDGNCLDKGVFLVRVFYNNYSRGEEYMSSSSIASSIIRLEIN